MVHHRTGRVRVLQCHQPQHPGSRHYDATEQIWWQHGWKLPENEYGSYEAVAAFLTGRTGKPVSRQQVYAWRSSRYVNGFPAGYISVYDEVPADCREEAKRTLRAQLIRWVSRQGYTDDRAVKEADRLLGSETPVRLSGKSTDEWFRFEEVARWHKDYVPHPGRPKGSRK